MSEWSIRDLRAGDAPCVLDAFLTTDDMARQGNVTTREEAGAYVDRLCGEDHVAWVAVDAADEVLALAAAALDRANRNGWVFYWAHRRARGRRITSRLVTALSNDLLSRGGLHRLELGYRANNPASGAIARAAGFIQEGLEREKFEVDGVRVDVVTAARLVTDPWPPGRIRAQPGGR